MNLIVIEDNNNSSLYVSTRVKYISPSGNCFQTIYYRVHFLLTIYEYFVSDNKNTQLKKSVYLRIFHKIDSFHQLLHSCTFPLFSVLFSILLMEE